MKVTISKGGIIEMTATKDKPHELTAWFGKIAAAENSGEEQPVEICYKTNEPCKYGCKGLCRESY